MTFHGSKHTLGTLKSMGANMVDPYDVSVRDQTLGAAPTFQPFKFEARRARLDWRVLHGVDVNTMIRDVDLDTLEKIVNIVAFGDIEAEDTRHLTEINFVKVFRLSQLMIEYLLYVQDCLQTTNQWLQQDRVNTDKFVNAARIRIRELESALKLSKREARRARSTVKTYEMMAAVGGGTIPVAGGTVMTAGGTAPLRMEQSPSRMTAYREEMALRNELAALSDRLARAQAEGAQLRGERDEMFQHIRDIDSAMRNNRNALMTVGNASSYQSKLGEGAGARVLQEQLGRAQMEARRARGEAEDLQRDVERLMSEKRTLTADRDKLLRELMLAPGRAEGEGGQMGVMLADANGRARLLEAELADAQRDVAVLQKQLMKAMKDAAGTRPASSSGAFGQTPPGSSSHTLEEMHVVLQAVQETNRQMIHLHADQMQELRGELDFTQDKLVSSERQLAGARQEVSRLERALAAAEAASQRQAGGLQRLEPDNVRELRQRVTTLQNRTDQLEAENDDLDARLRVALSERERLVQDLERQGQALDRARGSPQPRPGAPDWKTEELERVRGQSEELVEAVRQRDAEIGRLRDTIRQLQAQVPQASPVAAPVGRVRQQVQQFETFAIKQEAVELPAPPSAATFAAAKDATSFRFPGGALVEDHDLASPTPSMTQRISRIGLAQEIAHLRPPPEEEAAEVGQTLQPLPLTSLQQRLSPQGQPLQPTQQGQPVQLLHPAGQVVQAPVLLQQQLAEEEYVPVPSPSLRHSRTASPPRAPFVPTLSSADIAAARSHMLERVAGLGPNELSTIIQDELRIITEEPFLFDGDDEARFRELLPNSVEGRPDVLAIEQHAAEDLELALELYENQCLDEVDERIASYGLDVDEQALTEREYVAAMRELQDRREALLDQVSPELQRRAETLRDGLLTHIDLRWREAADAVAGQRSVDSAAAAAAAPQTFTQLPSSSAQQRGGGPGSSLQAAAVVGGSGGATAAVQPQGTGAASGQYASSNTSNLSVSRYSRPPSIAEGDEERAIAAEQSVLSSQTGPVGRYGPQRDSPQAVRVTPRTSGQARADVDSSLTQIVSNSQQQLSQSLSGSRVGGGSSGAQWERVREGDRAPGGTQQQQYLQQRDEGQYEDEEQEREQYERRLLEQQQSSRRLVSPQYEARSAGGTSAGQAAAAGGTGGQWQPYEEEERRSVRAVGSRQSGVGGEASYASTRGGTAGVTQDPGVSDSPQGGGSVGGSVAGGAAAAFNTSIRSQQHQRNTNSASIRNNYASADYEDDDDDDDLPPLPLPTSRLHKEELDEYAVTAEDEALQQNDDASDFDVDMGANVAPVPRILGQVSAPKQQQQQQQPRRATAEPPPPERPVLTQAPSKGWANASLEPQRKQADEPADDEDDGAGSMEEGSVHGFDSLTHGAYSSMTARAVAAAETRAWGSPAVTTARPQGGAFGGGGSAAGGDADYMSNTGKFSDTIMSMRSGGDEIEELRDEQSGVSQGRGGDAYGRATPTRRGTFLRLDSGRGGQGAGDASSRGGGSSGGGGGGRGGAQASRPTIDDEDGFSDVEYA